MSNDYDVIACYARRRQKEAVADELAAKFPDGYWWLTGENHHEFRLPKAPRPRFEFLRETSDHDGGEVWRAYRVNCDPVTREETLEYVFGTSAFTREECRAQLSEVTES